MGPIGDLVIGVLPLTPAVMRCQGAGRRLRAGNQIVGTVGVIQRGLTWGTQTGACRDGTCIILVIWKMISIRPDINYYATCSQ